MNERIRRSRQQRLRFTAVVVGVFLILSVVSVLVMQRIALRNAQTMGEQVARSFSTGESANMRTYGQLLDSASRWLDSYVEEGKSPQEMAEWMGEYLSYVTETMGAAGLDMYGSIDGRVVAANYWEEGNTFDPTATVWYREAMAADGEIIYTDAYTDVVTGDLVVTIAQRVGSSDNVLAIDVFPRYFRNWANLEDLPAGSSYFLCDSSGQVLYYSTDWEGTVEEIQAYVDELNGEIAQGIHDKADSYIIDQEGQRRGVYYKVGDNGWISIITLPYSYLLSGMGQVMTWYILVFGVFLALTILMTLRDRKLNRTVELTNETVRVLGNSYYAIYRINFEAQTYTMLKSSDYIRGKLPPQGDYLRFLDVLKEVIEPGAYQDFVNSFSVDSIKRLVKRKVRDYGGDFQRLFNDEYRWVNVRLLFDESLDLDEAILCFRQVDEEKQRQLRQTQLLRESLENMKKSAEAKNLFFSNMSHDMRTPLNAIIGLSELAENHLEEPGTIEGYLRKINLSSKQLLGLINDVLEMSKLEQGKVRLESRPFLLKESIEESLDAFHLQAQREDKTFTTSFDLKDNAVVGDLVRIQQILNNLLSNAFKFTDVGGEISLSVRQLPSQNTPNYQIVVKDNGMGMTEEFLQRVFVPFEREVRFGARNVQGTGLGMSIVHSLVLQMNGQIDVESKLGEGSTFTVTLPLEVQEGEVPHPVLPQRQEEPDPGIQGKHILLAEDNELNMEIATELLEMEGVQVTQAWNGREALEKFRASPVGTFDGILMDMQMPEMNGCEAARAIRDLPRPDGATVPIIAVTANAFAEDIAATTAAGMNAHISKPIDFQILSRTLRTLLKEER